MSNKTPFKNCFIDEHSSHLYILWLLSIQIEIYKIIYIIKTGSKLYILFYSNKMNVSLFPSLSVKISFERYKCGRIELMSYIHSAAAVLWWWTLIYCNLCCCGWIRSVQSWASSADEGRTPEEAGDIHWHACSREWRSHHTSCPSHRGGLHKHTHTACRINRTDQGGGVTRQDLFFFSHLDSTSGIISMQCLRKPWVTKTSCPSWVMWSTLSSKPHMGQDFSKAGQHRDMT